jgi:phosphopentomutase
VPELDTLLQPNDLVVITADHGCDPTWRGTDHTREQVPILAFGPAMPARSIGRRNTFADVSATASEHLALGYSAGTPVMGGVPDSFAPRSVKCTTRTVSFFPHQQ